MLSHFWSDHFWLPANITWEDISNGPGKTVVYAEAKDFWAILPLVIFVLTLRFLIERYLFRPLGRFLKISDLKRKATPNAKLEEAYCKLSMSKKIVSSLAKQLDLSERQIERWWRLRSRQDKPSTLVKFSENMWKGTHFLLNVSVGLYAVWGQEWPWDIKLCINGYPHLGITPGIWWFYMTSASFYSSLIITQFWDVSRKDFWQMCVHHVATLVLLYSSWVCQYFRIGCLALILHEVADISLEFGKAAKYAKYQKTVDCMFALFVFSWVVTRFVMLPLYVISTPFASLPRSPIINVLHILLMLIFVLTLYWTWLIFMVVRRTIYAGHFSNDIRSSESEENDSDSIPRCLCRGRRGPKIETQEYYNQCQCCQQQRN